MNSLIADIIFLKRRLAELEKKLHKVSTYVMEQHIEHVWKDIHPDFCYEDDPNCYCKRKQEEYKKAIANIISGKS